jgi:hypothetical protein
MFLHSVADVVYNKSLNSGDVSSATITICNGSPKITVTVVSKIVKEKGTSVVKETAKIEGQWGNVYLVKKICWYFVKPILECIAGELKDKNSVIPF